MLAAGSLNLASNWAYIDNFWEGLASFGVGAGAVALTMYGGPGGIFGAGIVTGAVNDIISQTGNGVGLGQVNWDQVGISSLTSGVLAYFSYKVGSWVSGNLNMAFNQFSIESPVVKGIVSGAAAYAAGGYVGNYVGTLVLTGDPEMAKQNAWKGLYTNLATGAVFGGVGAYQYAKENKISPWTGEKIQRHHSDPIFLGGDERQSLTPMSESRHRALHREMNQYLKEQTDGFGHDMQPRRNNEGAFIRQNFDPNIRFDVTKRFYDLNRFRYWDARRDFYKIHKLK